MRVRLSLTATVLWTACAATADSAAQLTLPQALDLSRGAAELRARDSEIHAARDASVAAGALPDPELIVGIDNLPIDGVDRLHLTRDFMTMRRIGLMQEYPNPARRDARRAAARARVDAAFVQREIALREVLAGTALAWFQRCTATTAGAMVNNLAREIDVLAEVTGGRFATGEATAEEAVLPDLERALIQARHEEFAARARQATATLRRWIGPAADAPWSDDCQPPVIDPDALRHALHQHPDLLAFEPQARAIDAAVEEARSSLRPDWALTLSYQERGARFSDMVTLEVRVDLPLFASRRQLPLLASAGHARTAFEAEREAAVRAHEAMLESDLAELGRLEQAVNRYREVLLPLADKRVELAMAAWRGGASNLVEVVDVRRMRIETRLQAIELDGERAAFAAKLHYAYLPAIDSSPGVSP